jgi:general secretion pathway protein M
MSAPPRIVVRWRTWWRELAPREQRLVTGAAALVALALLWWVGFAPALRTLRTAPAAHAQLDGQLQQMLALQAQARALQAQPRANRDDALRALEASVGEGLGASARMQASAGNAGEGVLVAIRATPASNLAQWLTLARGNARAVPREIHITRSQAGVASGGGLGPGAGVGGATGPAGHGGTVRGPNAALAPGVSAAPRPGQAASGAAFPFAGNAGNPAVAGGAEALGARWDGTLLMSLPAR